MRVKRIEEVENYIRQEGAVSLQQLCDRFAVSMNTIRRDVDTLVQQGRVKKVYGGVVALGEQKERGTLPRELMDFQLRNREYLDVKQRIARCAAQLVHHGDTVFLDSGSTALQMLPYLADKKNLTVATYSLPALMELTRYPQIRAIALPGVVLGRTASVVGASTCRALGQINFSKGFFGCTGLSLERQLTNATFEECELKQVALRQCKLRYLLADHEKFDHAALMTYGEIASMDYLITDEAPTTDYLSYLEERQVALLLAGEET